MAPTLYQKLFKESGFCQKLRISRHPDHTILFKLHQHVVQILFKDCKERVQNSNVSITKKTFLGHKRVS